MKEQAKLVYVGIYRMHGAMHSGSSNELVINFVEPVDGRRHIGARGENIIYLLPVSDTYCTCGLDGTKVLSRNGC